MANTTLSTDPLTEQILAAAIEVHLHLGPGLLESIYEQALRHELHLRDIPHEFQKQVDVLYKGVAIKGQRIDLVAFGSVVVEIKAQRRQSDCFTAQLLSYLKSTGLRSGLVLNFGKDRLVDGIQRVSF